MDDKPTIFISHSTGKLPDTDVSVQLRKALVAALETKGWNVFLDSRSVEDGDLWRFEILYNLATSSAGIILLNEDAGKSTWVESEALIMCFRKSINQTFPLLPVVLPGANIDATFLKTYEPFQFNEIQRAVNRFADGQSVDAFVREIADNPNLEQGRLSGPGAIAWVEQVATLLAGVAPLVLRNAAAVIKLKISEEPLAFAGPEALPKVLATLMHAKPPIECLEALSKLVPALQEKQANQLRYHFTSKWVDNRSAETLLYSIREPAQRGLLALNTSNQNIAKVYTDRVQSEVPWPIFYTVSLPQPEGDYGDEEVLLQKVVDAIKREVVAESYESGWETLSDDESITKQLEDTFALAVLPQQYSIASLLKTLRARFPRIIFITMSGERNEHAFGWQEAGGRSLEPPLTLEKVREYGRLAAKLRVMFSPRFSN